MARSAQEQAPGALLPSFPSPHLGMHPRKIHDFGKGALAIYHGPGPHKGRAVRVVGPHAGGKNVHHVMLGGRFKGMGPMQVHAKHLSPLHQHEDRRSEMKSVRQFVESRLLRSEEEEEQDTLTHGRLFLKSIHALGGQASHGAIVGHAKKSPEYTPGHSISGLRHLHSHGYIKVHNVVGPDGGSHPQYAITSKGKHAIGR
jgi:hypothetical protein